MSSEGDTWTAWCSICHRSVAEARSQPEIEDAWSDHLRADHPLSAVVL